MVERLNTLDFSKEVFDVLTSYGVGRLFGPCCQRDSEPNCRNWYLNHSAGFSERKVTRHHL